MKLAKYAAYENKNLRITITNLKFKKFLSFIYLLSNLITRKNHSEKMKLEAIV